MIDDASVDEVYSARFLQRLQGTERTVFVEELYRALKPGAEALIITPYWTSVGTIRNPTHK
ncbi:MAG: hypothetical protein JNN30_14340 [Rhodanobacteraceae bacterium]|nr:hypothetical protein [Rhodanobacteraceae bacterium]